MFFKYHVSLHPSCQVLSQRMWMKRNLLSMLQQLQSNPVRGQVWPVQAQPEWLVRRKVATSPKRQATKVKSTQRHWRSRQMRAAQQVQLFGRIDVRSVVMQGENMYEYVWTCRRIYILKTLFFVLFEVNLSLCFRGCWFESRFGKPAILFVEKTNKRGLWFLFRSSVVSSPSEFVCHGFTISQ